MPSFSPPLQITDDFMVPNLASPPLPLPERIPKACVEKIEVKVEVNPTIEHAKRDKTEIIKHSEEMVKITKVCI